MQYTPLTSIVRSTEMKLSAQGIAQSPLQDGTALVFGPLENGMRVVQPSNGNPSEVFAGFSFAQTSAAPVLPTDNVRVQTLVADALGVVVIAKPNPWEIFVVDATTKSPIPIIGINGAEVTLSPVAANTTVIVTSRHQLTVQEAVSLVGHVQPGGYSGATYGQTGVAQQGTIYTDRFIVGVNWHTATQLRLSWNGQVGDQTSSGMLMNAQVVSVPTADYPFLGIQFDTL